MSRQDSEQLEVQKKIEAKLDLMRAQESAIWLFAVSLLLGGFFAALANGCLSVCSKVQSVSGLITGTRDDLVPDEKYTEYGRGFGSYTLQVTATNALGLQQVATATLLSSSWAITAAHVVDGCTGIKVDGHAVDKAFVHEGWRDVFGENDIALLRLAEPIHLDFYPPLATREHEVGSTVSIAGYGVTGPMSTGFDSADRKLRAGTNTIARYERHMLVCKLARGSSPLEFGIAPGDSGGPTFCDGELVGVNSMTMADKGPLRSKEGEETGHTNIIKFVPWIRRIMGEGR